MVKLTSLPGYVVAVVHEDFERALATVATMYSTELKPIDQVHVDGTRVRMYLMAQSVAMTALAMGAINIDLPLFVLGASNDPSGRSGFLCMGAEVNPEYGNVSLEPVARIRFTSVDVELHEPYYEDIDGTRFKIDLLDTQQIAA